MKRWYAVNTHPRAEEKALAHLERQGFEAYLPQYLRRRSHARRIEMVRTPLFPAYLFIAFDPEVARWRSVNGTIGCRRIICNGETPSALPDGLIDDLRRNENGQGLIDMRPQAYSYVPNQPLRITSGPFADLVGLFQSVSDNERVMLMLDLLGRPVRVQVHAATVEAA